MVWGVSNILLCFVSGLVLQRLLVSFIVTGRCPYVILCRVLLPPVYKYFQILELQPAAVICRLTTSNLLWTSAWACTDHASCQMRLLISTCHVSIILSTQDLAWKYGVVPCTLQEYSWSCSLRITHKILELFSVQHKDLKLFHVHYKDIVAHKILELFFYTTFNI